MMSPELAWVKQKTPGMAPRIFLNVKGLVYFTICKREVAEVSSVMSMVSTQRSFVGWASAGVEIKNRTSASK